MYRGERHKPGRLAVTLNCSVCAARNYKTTKVRTQGQNPLELKKFCKTCGQHTLHQEGK